MKFDPEVNPILEFISSTNNPNLTRDFAFEKAVEFYNKKKYFEAHEIFEFQWKKEIGDMKIFQQALIQICIAMNKIFVNINLIGARSQSEKALDKLKILFNKDFFSLEGKDFCKELILNLEQIIKILDNSNVDLDKYKAFPIHKNWKNLVLT